MVNKSKIIRTWRGWTTMENAVIYESMLINEVFPAVQKKAQHHEFIKELNF